MNKILVLLSVFFLLSTGCSRLDIAYHWADTYIASKVDDYFDISSQQSKELKSSIRKDLQEIQTAVIPGWIKNLKNIEKDVNENSLNQDRIAFYFSSFMKDVDQLSSHFSDTAVGFISTTKPDQIAYFEKSFHKKNEEDLKKAQDVTKIQKEYRGKYIDWLEMFVGSLTKEQTKMLDEHLASSPFPAELKIKNKEYLFAKFIVNKKSPEQMKEFVRAYYQDPQHFELPEYRTAYNSYQQSLQKLISQIICTLTPDQKKALMNNLIEKTAQLERIAQHG